MPEPQFLNVLAIKKIAYRKGCVAERTATIRYRHYVQIWDAKGRVIDGARPGTGFSLAEAKRTLEAMPDRRNSAAPGSMNPRAVRTKAE